MSSSSVSIAGEESGSRPSRPSAFSVSLAPILVTLTFARSNRTFDVAAIGFRLPFDQRTQFFEDVFENFRVTVVVFDDAFQQFVYAVPDLAIDTNPNVLCIPQLRQLV